MRHIKRIILSLLAVFSLSIAGTTVAAAQAPELSSALLGSSSTADPPAPKTLEARLEASYGTWISDSGLTRTEGLDNLAEAWVTEAARSDWDYEYFTDGIGIISGGLETGEGIEILRYTAAAAEYWADRGIGEFMIDDPTGLQGLASARGTGSPDADYVYIVLVGHH